MVRIEDIARAALAYEALTVRALIQDLLRESPDWASIPRPVAVDENTLVVAAAPACGTGGGMLAEAQR